MKHYILLGLSCLAVQFSYAVEPQQVAFIAPLSLCEKSDIGSFQYDLKLKGNTQRGLISGTADTNH